MALIKSTSTVSGGNIWKFTALDSACYAMVVKGQWLFQKAPDAELMKSSLSRLLDYYPHLAGRVKDNNCIEMNNAGAVFEVVDDYLHTIADVKGMKKPLDKLNAGINMKEFRKGNAAPLSVRLTKLFDGAVLNVHCAHVCLDGTGFYSFVDNWGKMTRGEEIAIPVIDQSVIPVGGELTKEATNDRANEHGWKHVGFSGLVRFVFQNAAGITSTTAGPIHISDEQINTLKNRLADLGVKCSTHAALSALVTKMIIQMNGFKSPVSCTESSVVDFRGRLANVPERYAGNAVINVEANGFSSDSSIAEIAVVINESMQKIRTKALEEIIQLSINAMYHKLPLAPFDLKAMNSAKPSVFCINNQRKFPVYNVDFGAGKPVLAFPNDLPDQVKFWPSNPDNPGVDIYLGSQPAVRYNNFQGRDNLVEEQLLNIGK